MSKAGDEIRDLSEELGYELTWAEYEQICREVQTETVDPTFTVRD